MLSEKNKGTEKSIHSKNEPPMTIVITTKLQQIFVWFKMSAFHDIGANCDSLPESKAGTRTKEGQAQTEAGKQEPILRSRVTTPAL
jgi:hypothetical protein